MNKLEFTSKERDEIYRIANTTRSDAYATVCRKVLAFLAEQEKAEQPHLRRMQANRGHIGAHSIEHDENENCIVEPACVPVEPPEARSCATCDWYSFRVQGTRRADCAEPTDRQCQYPELPLWMPKGHSTEVDKKIKALADKPQPVHSIADHEPAYDEQEFAEMFKMVLAGCCDDTFNADGVLRAQKAMEITDAGMAALKKRKK